VLPLNGNPVRTARAGMGFLEVFLNFEAVFVKHSELRVQKRTKKYGKRTQNTLSGLVLTRPYKNKGVVILGLRFAKTITLIIKSF